MAQQKIPDRQPIHDTFSGIVNQYDNHYILSEQALPSTEIFAQGDFVVRYGITYLGKPHYSIVPDLVVLDYGDMLVSDEAWEFLINQSNLYPRADVLGFRNDGTDEMLVVKQLDFAVPFDVLIYQSESDNTPIAKLTALIAPESDSHPPRLIQYLPRYDTLADWQEANERS